MNDDISNSDQDQWARDIRTRPLAAQVSNRDQLMFDCGRAAARQDVRQVSSSNPKTSSTIRQCLIVACSICLGAVLMHWNRTSEIDEGEPQQVVQDTSSPSLPREQSNQWQQDLSEEELTAIQSGRILHASSQLITTNSYPISTAQPPLSEDAVYRAGMPHWIELIQ